MTEQRGSGVFLDRDGVIVEEVDHLGHPDQLRLIPGSARAIRLLNDQNVPVLVVSNQAGVARGYYPEARVAEVHDALQSLLGAEQAHVDAFYYCPHHPTHGVGEYLTRCDCRKPRPGMLSRAAADHAIDLGSSVMVGDKASDIGAGRAAGCATVLVQTGHGADEWRRWGESFQPDLVAADLLEAVPWIASRVRAR